MSDVPKLREMIDELREWEKMAYPKSVQNKHKSYLHLTVDIR
jgi:hypothetical protein